MNTTIRWGSTVALVIQCATASGNIISNSDTFDLAPAAVFFSIENQFGTPPLTGSSNTGPASDSETVTLNQFNPSLGMLNSVTIEFTGGYTGMTTMAAVNDGPTSTDFFADGTLTLSLKGTGLIADQSLTPLPMATAECDALADGGSCSNKMATVSGSYAGSTPGLTLAPFIGTGQFNLTASLSSALSPRTDPDNGSDFADNASMSGVFSSNWGTSVAPVTVKVTYDFTPAAVTVPEPLTLYLLAGGLGAIALMRRRRR